MTLGISASGAKPRASDIAYDQLLSQILDLRLPPGSTIDEHAVAAELGLSRMPVHEAVARLAADRLVTVLPRRGSIVTGVRTQDALDMFDAREAIECGIAHVAARRATDEDLGRLRTLIESAERAAKTPTICGTCGRTMISITFSSTWCPTHFFRTPPTDC